MKKLFSIFVLLAFLLMGFDVAAQGQLAVDETGLLTSEEIEDINRRCAEASGRLGLKVTVLFTAEDFDGEVYEAAADYYDRVFYGEEGVILYVNFYTRDYAVVSSGEVIDRELSEKPVAYILDNYILNELRAEDYCGAVSSFIEGLDYVFVHSADFVEQPLSTVEIVTDSALIAAFGGLVVGLIPTLINYYQLKNCAPKKEAQDYIDPQRVKIYRSGDLFLYRTSKRVRIADNSGDSKGGSTRFTGSSGISHVGGSRKF